MSNFDSRYYGRLELSVLLTFLIYSTRYSETILSLYSDFTFLTSFYLLYPFRDLMSLFVHCMLSFILVNKYLTPTLSKTTTSSHWGYREIVDSYTLLEELFDLVEKVRLISWWHLSRQVLPREPTSHDPTRNLQFP